ncbi:MAG: phenylacetate-CoA oxygenase subunit PaaJ [Alphaproteobacteria bacterium]|nr:phenylacetate-CoA oxygenase subunit PaaJ [Alphaproteobacteria bacterium]
MSADRLARARRALERVRDPELPALSIAEIGILREVRLEGETLVVAVTPTYSGCPAMGLIVAEIRRVLRDAGIGEARIDTRLAPAWSTDWIDAAARAKLAAAGIAPPERDRPVSCPRCGAGAVETLSEFGATACKALMRCTACREPFERFKCH